LIRLVTLDPFDDELLHKLTRLLFQAFGLGCEYVGEVGMPEEARKGDALDAVLLVTHASAVRSFADDKVVYLTSRKLLPRELPSGAAPTAGFSQYSGERAVITSHGLPTGDALLKRVGKQAIHDVGHLWDLHHCLDPRCAMHPPWTPTFGAGEPVLCPFCRDKSEARIRLAKT
jgi:predicted Zn-dependent protease